MQHDVTLHPRYFGSQVLNMVANKLYADVEGTCYGRKGYIVSVTSIESIGAGIVSADDGMVHYRDIKFNAIVFRPFKGEVCDSIVKQVNKVGIFVEIGPMTCFINRHSIPKQYTFENSNVPCYKSEGDDPPIIIDEHIRVKIIGIKMDMSGLFAVGSLLEDFLGVIEN
jgi:DNA-directed RNA polymerase subunit E'/Rpb7